MIVRHYMMGQGRVSDIISLSVTVTELDIEMYVMEVGTVWFHVTENIVTLVCSVTAKAWNFTAILMSGIAFSRSVAMKAC
ncbi:hypothetical protein J6590_083005 [Homalodisca vitripennis]|nr:hypothetical protein J6590_083005 [Homalodisca vitripennis]